MSYNQKVLSHLQNFWINHEIKRFSWTLGRIIEELPDFQVFQVIPNHEDEPWVYVSSGIGQFLGQEFFIVSPFETPEHIETLAMLASASMHYPDQYRQTVGRAIILPAFSDFSALSLWARVGIYG